jgi:hypothetical protein
MFAAAPLAIAFVRRGGPGQALTERRPAAASVPVGSIRAPAASGADGRAEADHEEAVN